MIDAHHHCWQLGRNDCVWPTADLVPIYRDAALDEFVPLARAAGVMGSVLVQSQESDRDTDYLLAIAAQSDFVKAVVGWVDLIAETAPARIAQLALQPKLRGLRPMLQAIPDSNWILCDDLAPAISAMVEHGLCFDALVTARHLPALYAFAQRYPNLRIVIDHGAKPNIAAQSAQQYAQWQQEMVRLAGLPQVYCKLSGLITEAAAHQVEADLTPYITYLYRVFGAERLMWGSDWPVVHLAANTAFASYEAWLRASLAVLSGNHTLSHQDVRAIFGETCLNFYQVG